MRTLTGSRCGGLCASVAALLALATSADAQVTPAAGYVPPDDTPSIRVGVTIFADYTYQTDPKQGRRWQLVFAQLVRREAGVHQRHRQHLAPDRVPGHAGYHARDGDRQFAQRQLHLPAQVRLRPVQLRRLDDARIVGTLRPAADAVGRLHGRHLAVSLPGHDLRGSRGVPVLVGLRRPRSTTTSATTTATCTSASTTASVLRSPSGRTTRRAS